MQEIKFEESIDERIDIYLAKLLSFSRSKVAKMLKDKLILVNDKEVNPSYRLKIGDVLTIDEYVEEELSAEPEKMDLNIVYEDDDIIVINKENGVVVHPAIGNNKGTLVNGLLYHANELSGVNGKFRPGIVHRIDAYTTGLLMVAKNDEIHAKLADQLSNKTTTRVYHALVWGKINHDTGTVDAPIGRDTKDRKRMMVTALNSKPAITHFKVLERYANATLIECRLETGRTHQIRVHMDYIGYPIVNDPVYGRKTLIDESGQCLHAKTLGFIHPRTEQYLEFDSELPECFTKIQNILREE